MVTLMTEGVSLVTLMTERLALVTLMTERVALVTLMTGRVASVKRIVELLKGSALLCTCCSWEILIENSPSPLHIDTINSPLDNSSDS